MFKKVRIAVLGGILIALVIIIAGAFPVFAAPLNDNFDDAHEIFSVPFTDNLDTTEATVGFDDPWLNCYGAPQATVWYKYTPAEYEKLDASTAGSSYPTVIGVFVDQGGWLESIACAYAYDNDPIATFNTVPGTTYYIMISAAEDAGPYPYPDPGDVYGGDLVITLQEHQLVPPEAWFDFWMSGALEYEFWNNSWDPEGFEIVSANWEFGDGETSTDLYGTSHQFQSEGYYDVTLVVTTTDDRTASITRTVDAFLPQPEADFWFDPYEPSTFDLIHFYNYSWDPANEEMTAQWDFGDGSTSEEWSPYHQYDSDGDYQVTLTITTSDGRSASTSREVEVSTHDVAINQFIVPRNARVGLTRHLEVALSNKVQNELVRVYLYKSTNEPWNEWKLVGWLEQNVPVKENQTTKFVFSYTFSAEDGEIGKLSFRAEAEIVNERDAIPADNSAESRPVKVIP